MRTFKYYLLFLIFLSSCVLTILLIIRLCHLKSVTQQMAKLHIPIDGII